MTEGQAALIATPDPRAVPASARHAILAGIIGNGLEWYNFTLYGFFAALIGRLFFPSELPLKSLLLSLGTFGVGFGMRPVGGLLLGIYSDRFGRKPALSLTILTMCVGTAILACTPSYATIGPAAPALIVLARLLQGFSTGGEMGNATAFMKDYAPPGRRAYYLSWVYASSGLFIALGAGVALASDYLFGRAALEDWGWRVPFLLGLVIGPVGFYLRRSIPDPARERRSEERPKGQPEGRWFSPLRDVLLIYPRETVASGALIALSTIGTYVVHVYTPTYATHTLHLSAATGYRAAMTGSVISGLLTPPAGWLADRIGTRTMLRFAAIGIFLCAWPLFALVNNQPGLFSLVLYQIVFAVLTAAQHGGLLAGIDELFPGRALATGLSLADNIVVMVFGGSAAFIITTLIAATGSTMVPVFYIMMGAVIGLLGTFGRPRAAAAV